MSDALFYAAPHKVEIRPSSMTKTLAPGEALVRALFSGVSRGTERLVCAGKVPTSEHQRMRAPFQEGEFPFPVKYGYASVGVVVAGPAALLGRRVFALYPHQNLFTIPSEALTPLPDAVPSRRAVLSANMETALNAVWDSGAGPGDRIAVVGGGALGCLIAGLCAGLPGAETVLVDVASERAATASAMGAQFLEPQAARAAALEADVVFHTSASEVGLETALALAGLEARIVEASWYGDHAPRAPLGGAFHSRRLSLISSQVGAVAPSRRPRWSYARRLAKAVELLADPRYEALITTEIAFAEAPEKLPALLADGAPGLATVIRHPDPAKSGGASGGEN